MQLERVRIVSNLSLCKRKEVFERLKQEERDFFWGSTFSCSGHIDKRMP